MIYSMTGFGKAVFEKESKKYTAEIRSLNSKSLDLKTRIPSRFREKEMELRNLLSQSLQRGKVDFTLNVEDNSGKPAVKINENLFAEYHRSLKALGEKLDEKPDYFSLIMNLPDVIHSEMTEIETDEWETVLKTTKSACEEINNFRQNEGAELEKDLLSHVKNIETLLSEISTYENERIEGLKSRIKSNLDENIGKENINNERLEQELIFYIEKLDVNEEKVRLKSHCDYFRQTIGSDNLAEGKKLGFIAQEMGREINTLGSKANHAEMQKIVVKMKDELEKIKEQTLNIL